MDFLSEILPLLIVGAIYLIGAVGKKKKEQASRQAPQPVDVEVRDVVIPTPMNTTKRVQKKAQPTPKSPSPFLSHDLLQNRERLPDNEPILLEEEAQSSSLPDFQDAEELRKAVIYSEILTRKY